MDKYIIGKTVDQFSDIIWTKLSSKHITDHDGFLYIAVKFPD